MLIPIILNKAPLLLVYLLYYRRAGGARYTQGLGYIREQDIPGTALAPLLALRENSIISYTFLDFSMPLYILGLILGPMLGSCRAHCGPIL